jgi:hypothetical protein
MVFWPSAHFVEFAIEGVFELFELVGQFAVDVAHLSLEIESEDEVYVFL